MTWGGNTTGSGSLRAGLNVLSSSYDYRAKVALCDRIGM